MEGSLYSGLGFRVEPCVKRLCNTSKPANCKALGHGRCVKAWRRVLKLYGFIQDHLCSGMPRYKGPSKAVWPGVGAPLKLAMACCSYLGGFVAGGKIQDSLEIRVSVSLGINKHPLHVGLSVRPVGEQCHVWAI